MLMKWVFCFNKKDVKIDSPLRQVEKPQENDIKNKM